MKSVGEVMGIGRSFNEAVQKACQSLENNALGLGYYGKSLMHAEELQEYIKTPKWDRIFRIKDALMLGISKGTISKATNGIDRWFLSEIEKLVEIEKRLAEYNLETIPAELFWEAKTNGFSDAQISEITGHSNEDDVYNKRKELGINRVYKMVDTCSAEFEAKTPYFYSTFEMPLKAGEQGIVQNESKVSDRKKIIVLGSGPNRIGQGIEFDYCCVHGLLAVKEAGYEAIMLNCNPETVSTDFDMADKLYFEPVFWEHVRELIEYEKPEGVIVQLGGQTALKLAEKIKDLGVNIIGTSFDSMDIAEDRGRFSDMLKELKIPYPDYGTAWNVDDAIEVANRVGYPVLVRPSYVLGGQRMRIVLNDEEVENAVVSLLKHIPGNKILIDHFLDRCQEAEIDAIYDGENFHVMGVMEHIEPAGIHSGDSHAMLPQFNLSPMEVTTMEYYAEKIAKALNIKGLINIQFAIKDGTVYVIPRGSKTSEKAGWR